MDVFEVIDKVTMIDIRKEIEEVRKYEQCLQTDAGGNNRFNSIQFNSILFAEYNSLIQ